MLRHLRIAISAAVLLSSLAVTGPARAHNPPILVGSLTSDSTLFWDGGSVGYDPIYSAPVVPSIPVAPRCEVAEPCYQYRIDVREPGAMLRIALDTPMRDDGFELTVISPSGASVTQNNSNRYSIEVRRPNPEVGRWTVLVAPYSAEYADFRMRAKLESAPHVPTPDAEGRLLPNLRVTRLWEFGFVAPANPLNGLFPPDDANPPLEAAGQAPLSCALDEMAEDEAQRCLRYSFGLANVGDGVFDIRWTADRLNGFQMTQCIQRPNQTPLASPAGTGSWHKTHGHWHYDDVIFHDIWKVTDRSTGEMVKAGDGKKLGYSPADQGIAEWQRFVQAPAGTSGSAGNCAPGSDSRLGMSAGWGDAYRYQRPGNYVEFGANGDGWYVVRTIADPLGQVLESDESDNTSYAYVRVVGTEVDVLESGLGESPWDPDKVVFEL